LITLKVLLLLQLLQLNSLLGDMSLVIAYLLLCSLYEGFHCLDIWVSLAELALKHLVLPLQCQACVSVGLDMHQHLLRQALYMLIQIGLCIFTLW